MTLYVKWNLWIKGHWVSFLIGCAYLRGLSRVHSFPCVTRVPSYVKQLVALFHTLAAISVTLCWASLHEIWQWSPVLILCSMSGLLGWFREYQGRIHEGKGGGDSPSHLPTPHHFLCLAGSGGLVRGVKTVFPTSSWTNTHESSLQGSPSYAEIPTA